MLVLSSTRVSVYNKLHKAGRCFSQLSVNPFGFGKYLAV
jgi:hypothetical protein